MRALICGSMAYDTIMVFPGKFGDQIHPQRIHILNVSFLVPELRREFGGCAGNIAFNMGLLGSQGDPMGTVGHDFAPYRARFGRVPRFRVGLHAGSVVVSEVGDGRRGPGRGRDDW